MKYSIFPLLACLLASICFSCAPSPTTDNPDKIQSEPCAVVPAELDFGNVIKHSYAEDSVTIKLKVQQLDTIGMDDDVFSFIDPLSGEPSDTLYTGNLDYTWNAESYTYDTKVGIRFSPDSAKKEDCWITFSHTDDEEVNLCPTLYIEGTGFEGCGFDPTYIDFHPIQVGEHADSTVWLSVGAWPPDNPTIECDAFRFVDPITQQAVTTLDFSHPDYPHEYLPGIEQYEAELTFRFVPQTPGTKYCDVNIVRTGQDAYDCPTFSLYGIASEYTGGDWTWMDPVTAYDLKDVYGRDDEVYACGDAGTVIRHTHGDMHFTLWIEEGFDETPLEAIWADTVNAFNPVWVGGGIVDGGFTYGKLYRYSDANSTWSLVDYSWWLDMVTAIWGTTEIEMYMGGPAISGMMPTLYHWNGIELTDEYLGMGYEKVTGIHGTMPENVWATTDYSLYNVYHYDGENWSLNREEWMDQPCYDVWAAPGGDQAWAVGANGAIYHWNGSAWDDQSIPNETRTIYGIWGFSVVDVYAVGEDWLIYHRDMDGWEEITPSAIVGSQTLYAVWGTRSPQEYIYAVGTNGTTLRYAPNP